MDDRLISLNMILNAIDANNGILYDNPTLVVSLKKMINALPSAQPRWILVTERFPQNDNDVLVTDGTDCAVAYWHKDAQAWDDSFHGWCDLYGLDVVAWMPLPTPSQ